VPPGASLLSVVAQRLSRFLRSQLGRLLINTGDISLVEWRIYIGLAQHDAVTQKDLIAFTEIEQGQVSRSLARMEKRHLIKSRQSTADRRVRLYSLTETGRAEFDTILPSVTAYHEAIDRALSPEEQRQFLDMAERIVDAAAIRRTERPEFQRKAG